MYEVVPKTDCETWHYYVEEMMVSITKPASGGEDAAIIFKEGDGTEWFRLPAYARGVYNFNLGPDGYCIAAKDSEGFQVISADAETEQAEVWVLFRGHRRFN
jgi:hypothetical protein